MFSGGFHIFFLFFFFVIFKKFPPRGCKRDSAYEAKICIDDFFRFVTTFAPFIIYERAVCKLKKKNKKIPSSKKEICHRPHLGANQQGEATSCWRETRDVFISYFERLLFFLRVRLDKTLQMEMFGFFCFSRHATTAKVCACLSIRSYRKDARLFRSI